MEALSRLEPFALSLLRAMSGLLILQNGTAKYLNFPAGPMNNASVSTMPGAAGIFELVCGFLLLIGLFTRINAFLLSGMTAVAYFYAHAPRGFYPILNGGGFAVLYSFVFLFLAIAGGGPISIDRLFSRKE
jgi:putative oxidoreductase